MMATRAMTRLAPAPLKRWVRRARTGPHRAAEAGAGEELRAAYDYMERQGIQSGVSNALMVQRALDRGVEVRAGRDGRVQLQFQGTTAWFNASNSSLNRRLVKRVTGNKAVTTAFLRAEGIRAPENLVFDVDEVDRGWAWAEPILPVVVKPRRGQGGRSVHVDLRSRADFERAFTAVAAEGDAVLVEQSVPGVDHRVTVVDGRAIGATRRIPAHVVGDGTSTVAALVEEKNAERRARANPVHKKLKLGPNELACLAEQSLDPTHVPPAGQRVWLRRAANVSTGGDAIDATDSLTQEQIDYVERAVSTFPGLRLCGADVLVDPDGRADPWIIEVNSKPSVSPHHFPWEGQSRDVMTAVLEAMFPNLPPRG